MRYKGRNDLNTKELQGLWEVKLYEGNPDAKKPKFKTETVAAWNHVDAIRQCGKRHVAEMPRFLHYVTWADDKGMRYVIYDTTGPTDEIVSQSMRSME